MPADVQDGALTAEHAENLIFIVQQEVEFGTAAFPAAEYHSICLAHSKGLLGAHGDEVSFYFCNEAECETKNLAVDTVIERVSFLSGVETDFFPQAFCHNLHNLCQRPAEP